MDGVFFFRRFFGLDFLDGNDLIKNVLGIDESPGNVFARGIDKPFSEDSKGTHVVFTVPREADGSEFKKFFSEKDLVKVLDYLLCINVKENKKNFHKFFDMLRGIGAGEFKNIDFWETLYFEKINTLLENLDESVMKRRVLVANLKSTYSHMIKTYKHYTFSRAIADAPMDFATLLTMFSKSIKERTKTCFSGETKKVIVITEANNAYTYKTFLDISFKTKPNLLFANSYIQETCLEVDEFDFFSVI